MMHARGLRYGGVALHVEADAQCHLRWLMDCLRPSFVEGDTTERDAVRVRLIHDAARHRDLLVRGPAPDGGCLPCFLLDRYVVRHPLWSSAGGTRTIHDAEYRVFYVVDGDGVDIVADGSSQWSRIALFRVVREVVLARAAGGALHLHAAAATVDPRGMLLVGPKRAGKTSLLFHLLGHPNARLVANDRVVVHGADALASFTGVPTIVKVREGTLRLFQDRLGGCDRHADLACRRDGEPPREGELARGLLLNPAQLAGLVGRGRAAGASLDAIVFPRVIGTAEISLRPLSPEDAAPQLAASLFGAGADEAKGSALAPDVKVSLGAFPDQCVRLASRVRCLECRMGPRAYMSDPGARRFVADVLA